METRDQSAVEKPPRTQIVVADAPVGLLAGAAVLVAVSFVAIAKTDTAGLAGAPMKIEALPIPQTD